MDVLIDGMHSLPVGAKPFKDPEAGNWGAFKHREGESTKAERRGGAARVASKAL